VARLVRRGSRATLAPQEFDHFVSDSVDALLRSAYLIVWNFAEAEDLVQECLLRIARRWPRVRRMEHPVAYARKVLVNLALDESRRFSRHRAELVRSGPYSIDDEDDAAVRMLGWVEDNTDLTRALAELAPRQRVALVLRYFDDLPEAQVAEVMGCSVGTVKSTTWRALERLRESVEPRLPAATPVTPVPTTTTTAVAAAAAVPTEGSGT
jgi:RNA polymerase sigma-70 factor (sigma-E family)